MAKRKGDCGPGGIVVRRKSGDTLLRCNGTLGFLNNKYLKQLYEQLHTNVLYSWLRGDLGPIDDPVVSRDYLWNLWRDMNVNGFFTVAYITEYYVDKEIDFWHRVIPPPNRIERVWRQEYTQPI